MAEVTGLEPVMWISKTHALTNLAIPPLFDQPLPDPILLALYKLAVSALRGSVTVIFQRLGV